MRISSVQTQLSTNESKSLCRELHYCRLVVYKEIQNFFSSGVLLEYPERLCTDASTA